MKRRNALAQLFAGFAAISCFGLAAPAYAADEIVKPQAGHAVIHYFRADGQYDAWGLHVWESFEKVENGKVVSGKEKSDRNYPNVGWMSPMKPSGKDGFGSYWQLKLEEFDNGKVNYIVHRGDKKDCVKDSAMMAAETKEIFLNSGDCTPYATADEALKARKP